MIAAAELIQRKRDGDELSTCELSELVLGHTRGQIPDYQMAAFLMAVYFSGLSPAETFALTDAMVRSGETLELGLALGRKVVDKHSTGGVGDKTSIAVGPIVAACGVPFAKMSGRGLGHTGGTLDKLESIPGYRVELSTDEFVSQVREAAETVRGNGPVDFSELVIDSVAHLLALSDLGVDEDEGRRRAEQAVTSGAAFDAYDRWIRAQHGDPELDRLPSAPVVLPVPAPRAGAVASLGAIRIGVAALHLGAGRRAKGDAIDHAVGIVCLKKRGDAVEQGEWLAEVHARDSDGAEQAAAAVLAAYELSDTTSPARPIVLEVLT